ncbi:hypothetical protein BA896_023305 [Janthinobacterium lividum]|uniref:Uncharacterized protein n=1 Tax=Janthinobacterium lividum TaxID=29581 RepID=A0A1E8PPN8_9BURK|nr:hypothetical protein BA896_023305 [Janthinobacterium lividum]
MRTANNSSHFFYQFSEEIMSQSEMTKLAMAFGILYGVYKFVPNQLAKAAALGVAGVIIGKRVPVLKDVL